MSLEDASMSRTHPIPPGYQWVPVDPEGERSTPDLINVMVDAWNKTDGGKYDGMLAAYRAMLAATKGPG